MNNYYPYVLFRVTRNKVNCMCKTDKIIVNWSISPSYSNGVAWNVLLSVERLFLYSGTVEQLEQWNSGTVEHWNSGTVESRYLAPSENQRDWFDKKDKLEVSNKIQKRSGLHTVINIKLSSTCKGELVPTLLLRSATRDVLRHGHVYGKITPSWLTADNHYEACRSVNMSMLFYIIIWPYLQ